VSGTPAPRDVHRVTNAEARGALRLEQLIGREVVDLRGRKVGRLTELRAEPRDGTLEITSFLIGSWGMLERLAMQRLFPARGYRARWDQIDLSDPERPRLTCYRSELELEPPAIERRNGR